MTTDHATRRNFFSMAAAATPRRLGFVGHVQPLPAGFVFLGFASPHKLIESARRIVVRDMLRRRRSAFSYAGCNLVLKAA